MTDGADALGASEPRVPVLRVAPRPIRWDLPAAERSTAESTAPERRHRVVLRFADRQVAIDGRHAKAVRTIEAVTPMPRTPPYVVGLAAVRGQILAVVDLSGLLGVAPVTGPPWQGVVVEAAGFTVVLVVDEVVDRRLASAAEAADVATSDGTDPADPTPLDLDRLLGDLHPSPRARSPIR